MPQCKKAQRLRPLQRRKHYRLYRLMAGKEGLSTCQTAMFFNRLGSLQQLIEQATSQRNSCQKGVCDMVCSKAIPMFKTGFTKILGTLHVDACCRSRRTRARLDLGVKAADKSITNAKQSSPLSTYETFDCRHFRRKFSSIQVIVYSVYSKSRMGHPTCWV